ncbi:MAG TPA: type I methionyl aminopeptidase [Pseudolysinimonas sp.]|nr:type I methionyl aminopeptidase [Pseudolysinimonas sp.]
MSRDAHGHLLPGRISPTRQVPASIERPEYVGKAGPRDYDGDDRYDAADIERIRTSGRIAARALEAVAASIRPGITTDELDAIGHDFLVAHDAYPSTLGYRGYRKSICTSINEVICHGIPDDTVLLDGDIINIDITAFHHGMHGDLNATFGVGEISLDAANLITRTREALDRGIKAVAPGREVNVIGRAIESYARRYGYGVVKDYTGHGVGSEFHSGLVIPHYDASPDYASVMEPGMVFTIEPMLTLGSLEHPGTSEWDEWDDGWTVVTRDRSLTAQFEHTLVVTERGAEILTLP